MAAHSFSRNALRLLARRFRVRHAAQASLLMLVCLLLATRASVRASPRPANGTSAARDEALRLELVHLGPLRGRAR